MKKLAIIITHPIQYYSPLFKLLSERKKIIIKVFYTWEQSQKKVFDDKFGKEIKWDIPLLDGYEYTFVKNISKNPGSVSFNGVVNPSLTTEIEQWNADAILVFGWNHHSHLKAMKHFKGKIPVYFRGDSTLLDEKSGMKTIMRRIWLKYVYSFVDKAFYVGTNNKEYYLKHGLKTGQLIFAPHAIDNSRFFDTEGKYEIEAKKQRKESGFGDKDIVVLFVGKFEPKKDPLILAKAAKKLPDIKFLFVGNGELEKELRENSKNLKNVKFLPFQNQSIMPVIYRISDIFILPSKGPGETWGLAVNEAMACGKAILTSDKVGCAIDLIKEGENGFILKAEDLNDLKNKIEMIANEHEMFGIASKSIISKWSFTAIAENIEYTLRNE